MYLSYRLGTPNVQVEEHSERWCCLATDDPCSQIGRFRRTNTFLLPNIQYYASLSPSVQTQICIPTAFTVSAEVHRASVTATIATFATIFVASVPNETAPL